MDDPPNTLLPEIAEASPEQEDVVIYIHGVNFRSADREKVHAQLHCGLAARGAKNFAVESIYWGGLGNVNSQLARSLPTSMPLIGEKLAYGEIVEMQARRVTFALDFEEAREAESFVNRYKSACETLDRGNLGEQNPLLNPPGISLVKRSLAIILNEDLFPPDEFKEVSLYRHFAAVIAHVLLNQGHSNLDLFVRQCNYHELCEILSLAFLPSFDAKLKGSRGPLRKLKVPFERYLIQRSFAALKPRTVNFVSDILTYFGNRDVILKHAGSQILDLVRTRSKVSIVAHSLGAVLLTDLLLASPTVAEALRGKLISIASIGTILGLLAETGYYPQNSVKHLIPSDAPWSNFFYKGDYLSSRVAPFFPQAVDCELSQPFWAFEELHSAYLGDSKFYERFATLGHDTPSVF